MRTISLMVALLAASPAHAVRQCHYIELDVYAATAVYQIAVMSVDDAPPGSMECRLTGEIVNTFRGDLFPGTVIETAFTCLNAPAGSGPDAPIMVGGDPYFTAADLRDTPYLELHVSPAGGPAGGAAGMVRLDAPTDFPAWRPECFS